MQLTIENADGALPYDSAEVSVSRRLYRSGESEIPYQRHERAASGYYMNCLWTQGLDATDIRSSDRAALRRL